MNAISKTAMAIAMAGMLSGCQSSPFFASIFGSKHPTAAARPAPELAGVQVLEEGRAQLRSGNVSAAIASFRMARMDPATVADANNGLGVAYVRLGRADLAEQYFTTAIELEPDNMRFAGNLMRLRNDLMLAQQRLIRERRAAAEVEAREQAELAAAVVEAPAPLAVSEPARRTPAVLHIATREDLGESPVVEVASREVPAVVEARPLPEVEVADVEEGDAEPSAPQPMIIEIALND